MNFTNEKLLEIAARSCDDNGFVHTKLPDQLAYELRKRKLLAGLKDNGATTPGCSAAWYVMLNEKIEKRIRPLHRRQLRNAD